MPLIREETAADHAAIREVNRLAFGRDAEAALVDRLRTEGWVCVSLVAEEAGAVTGHILFSRLPVETSRETLETVALAPVAVRPEAQRRGTGAALVRAGLEACRRRGQTIAIVLGDPAYYGRFGFTAAAARPLASPFAGEAFMALELVPGALGGVQGTVRYPAAFADTV